SCTSIISRSKYGIRVLDIFPNQIKKLPVPGLAIDIGTTTVAAILTDLNSTEILASGSRGNPQIRYGADVINRIIESTRPSGLERLRRILLDECIVPLVMELSVKAGISSTQIYRTAIAANTTMTHLFTGITPEYLRLEPYVPAFFRAKGLRAADLDLPIHPDAEVLIAPSVGSYVGGDISAGLFASMICSRDKYSLFIDLGTNGELVFGGREFLMTCACSAGPAFEGGDISCGMRAADGAIDSVSIDRETLEPDFTVIGNRMPAGICGSGLIDLVGELFEKQCIDPRGKFIGEAKPDGSGRSRIQRDEYGMASYIVAFADSTENQKDIYISEGDIDNFIRAKGAIFSAVRTMLAMLGFSIDDINEVYIAGGIGSGINVQKAIRIGMLPDIPAERYHYLGNTSLTGAWAMVQSQKTVQEIDKTADKMTYLELSSHPSYMDEFIAACFLPHTDSRLFGK
ncbi:MAG: ASKHA domain-containing protein, partial [Treponema sp.]|nr:ASKHA domain-containing protein [Treponema sp.]